MSERDLANLKRFEKIEVKAFKKRHKNKMTQEDIDIFRNGFGHGYLCALKSSEDI